MCKPRIKYEFNACPSTGTHAGAGLLLKNIGNLHSTSIFKNSGCLYFDRLIVVDHVETIEDTNYIYFKNLKTAQMFYAPHYLFVKNRYKPIPGEVRLFNASKLPETMGDPTLADVNAVKTFFADHTRMSYSSGHGTQLEYNAPNGATYLWYPGNDRILRGRWKVELKEFGPDNKKHVQICYAYGANSYNPATQQRGGAWECEPVVIAKAITRDMARGDPFHLSTATAAPFDLPPEPTTILQLIDRAP